MLYVPKCMDMQQRMACLTGSCHWWWFLYLSWLLNNKHYCTWLCRNKAMHKASHLLTLSLVCVCVPSTVYQCMWGESACRGVSGGLRYSACCQHRHISPSAPLHRYANPASSECRAPDQLQFIPFCSLPRSALTLLLCSFLLSVSLQTPPPPPPVSSLSQSCLWYFCLVLAALFVACTATEELYGGERIYTGHLQDYGLAKTPFFHSSMRCMIAWVCAFEHKYSLSVCMCVLVLVLSRIVCIMLTQKCTSAFPLANYQR